jgi:hypothetical protein
MPDVGYSLTRRLGHPVTVVRVPATAVNPRTGLRDMTTLLTNVRNVVKEPTAYSRLIKANAVQQTVGATTFLFWVTDVPFTRLEAEDYIIVDDVKFQVVTSSLENTTLVVTADEIVGAVGKQQVVMDVGNTIGGQVTATVE